MANISYMEEMAVVGMIKSGMSMPQIRKETGLSVKVVSKIAKAHDLKINRTRNKITPEIENKIIELSKLGYTSGEISRELMIGTSTCQIILKEHRDEMCEAPEGGEEVQLTIDPPDPPDGGQDPEELRDPLTMIQDALRLINGAIELIKEKYYE